LKKIVLLFKLTFVPEKTVTNVQKKQAPEAPSSNLSVFDRRRERALAYGERAPGRFSTFEAPLLLLLKYNTTRKKKKKVGAAGKGEKR